MDAAAYREMAALEDRHWWFVGRRRITDALLWRPALPPEASVLDGCGSGGNLTMLARYGRLSAGEFDAEARRLAAARGVAARVASCELPAVFPFDSERFDLIVMFDVLEHIEDDLATLAAVRRHLADGGWFVLTVPAFPFLWSPHDTYNHHFRRYTRAGLMKRLADAGLRPAYCSFFNFWLFPLIALFRTIRKFGRDNEIGDLAMPPAPINRVLAALFSSERFAMGRLSLPFGVSLILTARAPRVGS